MPWKGVTEVDLRHEFVQFAKRAGCNFSQLCRGYDISRTTGYKWLNRFESEGKAGLVNQSTRPHESPNKTEEQLEAMIVEARLGHPAWGGRKIKPWLEQGGLLEVPAPSTITDILHRHGLIQPPVREQHAFCRFERALPNELWQMDFKGHVGMLNQKRCHPLTILDDHSRFSLTLSACEDERRQTVKSRLEKTFTCYGLPEGINVDNGPPWGGGGHSKYSQLSVWLIRLGIKVSYSRPYHPQTNGKDERFHRTLKGELLNHVQFKDIEEAQRYFDQWRNLYNLERPHEALDLQPPISRYRPSHRQYLEELKAVEYAPADTVRKVEKKGSISFQGQRIMVGVGFAGEKVAVRPSTVDGQYDVYFCHQRIKTLDIREVEK